MGSAIAAGLALAAAVGFWIAGDRRVAIALASGAAVAVLNAEVWRMLVAALLADCEGATRKKVRRFGKGRLVALLFAKLAASFGAVGALLWWGKVEPVPFLVALSAGLLGMAGAGFWDAKRCAADEGEKSL